MSQKPSWLLRIYYKYFITCCLPSIGYNCTSSQWRNEEGRHVVFVPQQGWTIGCAVKGKREKVNWKWEVVSIGKPWFNNVSLYKHLWLVQLKNQWHKFGEPLAQNFRFVVNFFALEYLSVLREKEPTRKTSGWTVPVLAPAVSNWSSRLCVAVCNCSASRENWRVCLFRPLGILRYGKIQWTFIVPVFWSKGVSRVHYRPQTKFGAR